MTLYEALATICGVVIALIAVGGVTWRLGKSGRADPAANIYEEMNTALGLQVEQLKAQNADQQHQIEALKSEISVLREQVLQRAKVEELTSLVREGMDRMGEEHSTILGRIEATRRAG